jgi:hypothetical protein
MGSEPTIASIHHARLLSDKVEERLDTRAACGFSELHEICACDGREDVVVTDEWAV